MNPTLKANLDRIIEAYMASFNIAHLEELLKNLIKKEYSKGLEKAEMDFDMNFTPDYAKKDMLEKFAVDNLRDVGEEMKNKLRQELTAGMLNMEDVNQLSVRVRDVLKVSQERAKLIAVTESNRAFNQAHFDAAKDTGLALKKQWSAQPDKDDQNPCPVCAGLDRQIVEMDGYFKDKNGEKHLLPPVHPRCKCRVLYIQPVVVKARQKVYNVQQGEMGLRVVVEDA